jgi:hypothetical protein
MRVGLLVGVLGLAILPLSSVAGPKTQIKECDCSIKTPGGWYVLEYYQTPQGIEYLVTASPYERPGENNIPGVQFLRQKLDPGISATAEEMLSAVGAQLQGAKLTGPAASKFGKEDGAKLDAQYDGTGGKTYFQRYYATIRGSDAYVVIITWDNAQDLDKLEDSVHSVRF